MTYNLLIFEIYFIILLVGQVHIKINLSIIVKITLSGDTMHYLLNENWKYMMTHFGDIYMDKIADKVFDTFKNYMLDVPLKDINKC